MRDFPLPTVWLDLVLGAVARLGLWYPPGPLPADFLRLDLVPLPDPLRCPPERLTFAPAALPLLRLSPRLGRGHQSLPSVYRIR